MKSLVVDGAVAFVHLVVVALLVYVASWTGWLIHHHTYEEHLSSTQYTRFVAEGKTCKDPPKEDDRTWPTATEKPAHGIDATWQALRSLWYYHQDVYTFHTHFLNCSTHTYASMPSGWLLLNRPVGVSADTGIKPGTQGCDAPKGSDCLRQVLLLGTPVLWWGGCLALIAAGIAWVGARDWRPGVAVLGSLVTWLPWLQFDSRPIFSFYTVVTIPFMVLAIVLTMGRLIGLAGAPSGRRTAGVVVSGSFLVLVMVNFAWFWPIWTDQLLTHSQWLERIWFTRWI